tara:strand:- start:7910 stop:9307 length:1398 start_codon:yes stop_codon:yes gene_type:complete
MKRVRKKIAIGGISTECSTYSSLIQKESDFKTIENKSILDLVDFPFDQYNISVKPVFIKKSVPGGPVDADFYKTVKTQFINSLKSESPLDGVLLIMHGAMFVNGLEDPEGDWIEATRKTVGKDCIISVSFDLHGQVTNKIIKNINSFCAFRTAPHIDIKETYFRSAKILSDALVGGEKPKVVWSAIPLLVSGEMSSTFVEPCRSLYKSLDNLNKKKGILDANLMIGYIWADTKRATAAAVITCTDRNRGAKICDQLAMSYWGKRNNLDFDMPSGKIKDALKWLPNSFSIIADSGDNPTAGGIGDRADILKVILNEKLQKVIVAGIASPKTYNKLKSANKLTPFKIGGMLGGGGPTLHLEPEKLYIKNDCAIVNISGITLVITKYRRPFHFLNDFRELNIDINNYKLLIVKSGYLSPELKKITSNSFMVLSHGAVDQNIASLENKNRPVPTFPFQKNMSFEPNTNR